MGTVIGVVGGHGGAGASLLSACLAACRDAVLMDLDPLGGGLDVTLGIEAEPGVRWSGLFADGGRFDPVELLEALPRWGGVPVVACDRAVVPEARVVTAVLDAVPGLCVVDLGRSFSPTRSRVASHCDLVVVLAGRSVRAVAAAGAVLSGSDVAAERLRLLVRAGDGPLPARRVASVLGLPLAGVWPNDRVLGRAPDRGLPVTMLAPSTRRVCTALTAAVDTSTPMDVAA